MENDFKSRSSAVCRIGSGEWARSRDIFEWFQLLTRDHPEESSGDAPAEACSLPPVLRRTGRGRAERTHGDQISARPFSSARKPWAATSGGGLSSTVSACVARDGRCPGRSKASSGETPARVQQLLLCIRTNRFRWVERFQRPVTWLLGSPRRLAWMESSGFNAGVPWSTRST